MQKYHSRIHVRVRDLQRRFIRFLGGLSNRDFEYDFAYRNVVGQDLNILDVGGSESLLPLKFAKSGHSVTVYDFRDYPESHSNLTSTKGDFITNELPDDSFDYVVMVSTIEHVGFGSYDAPGYIDGDYKALEEARRVIKPSGRIVLTFPFASTETLVEGFERWYDINRVKMLFSGMHVLAEEYYIPQIIFLGRVLKWVPASLEQITSVDDVVKTFGYQCNACYLISPSKRVLFDDNQ